ncbi:MAG TPA: ATP-grasp domain-containing protein [Candidatus Nitrosotalea sp.]|nr:ATP-grasp domain-containing protein [Candidatus Nitrosotalea sp.]
MKNYYITWLQFISNKADKQRNRVYLMCATNVLVTATGGIVAQGIIKCFKLSNNQKKSNQCYKIIAVDTNARAAGMYRSDAGILVPPVISPDYLDFIIKTCIENKIKAIFIGSEEELVALTLASKEIEEKTGSIVIANPSSVLTKTTDKWKTFEFLKQNNLPCADSALLEDKEEFVKRYGFPLVVKPREGHGSMHFYLVENMEELSYAVKAIVKAGWKPLLQEYLNGDSEFTSGITVNKSGKVMTSISMRKILKSGQTYKAFIDDFRDVRQSAEKVAMKIGARGPINIQSKVVAGIPKIFEINGRISATCPLRAVAGINEPDVLFRNMVLGEDIKIDGYQRLVCMRYWNEVYIPYSSYEKAEQNKIIEPSESFIPDYF